MTSEAGSEWLPRAAGIVVGDLPTGPSNTITDVDGVRVGHVSIVRDEERTGAASSIRTGVTAIIPRPGNIYSTKVPAACHVINGFGKATGLSQIEELGTIETPIVLTNTLSVGAGMLGIVRHTLAANPGIRSVNAVVAECNDGWLSDIASLAIQPEHVLEALAQAHGGPVEQGGIGAGTGMLCYGWKGGIGSASRRVEVGLHSFVLGALVLSNFGHPEDLWICGVHVGKELRPPTTRPAGDGQSGSCVVVLATSAPMDSRQLGRLARRAQSGLARTGTYGEHGSGEYALAFSTACPSLSRPFEDVGAAEADAFGVDDAALNVLFKAAVEATEEAVLCSLFAAETVRGFRGRVATALPEDQVTALLRRARVL